MKHLRRTTRPLAAFVVGLTALVGLTACGGDTSVGDESAIAFDQDDAAAFGATTTEAPATTTPEVVETTSTTAAPVAETTTTVAQTTTTVAPAEQAVSIEVRILDGSPYFDPSVVAIPVGGTIRFLNAGTGTYSVLSDSGQFDSGPLAPGEVWIYTAATPGRFNYSDGGRPFAVGQFEVVA